MTSAMIDEVQSLTAELKKERLRPRVQVDCSKGGLTDQSFKDSCDINKIMKSWEQTGNIAHVNKGVPQFGDFSTVTNLHEAVQMVQAAEDSFGALPSALRARMDNDPQKLILFLQDPKNREEAITLGLIEAPPEIPEPVTETVTPEGETPS